MKLLWIGIGGQPRDHSAKILRLSEDLPIAVENADAREKLETFLAASRR